MIARKLYSYPIFLSVLICSCNAIKTSVFFGDRRLRDFDKMPSYTVSEGQVKENDSIDFVRMYFDREGMLYPPNTTMLYDQFKANGYSYYFNPLSLSEKTEERVRFRSEDITSNSSLQRYYDLYKLYSEKAENMNGNDVEFSKLGNAFKQQFDSISIHDYKVKIDSVIKAGNYNNVTFVMAGFNNTLVNPGDAFNSSEMKIKLQRDKIQSILDAYNAADSTDIKKNLFIEIHWDGRFIDRKGIKTALNYRPALRTSYKVGLTLRKVIASIDTSVTVNMISHSAGANIICESLFNQESKIKRKGKEHELWDYLHTKYTVENNNYATPHNRKKVVAAMLAPSIPGTETFNDYYKRSGDFKLDNYRMVIGYNVNDPDLRKKFRSGPVGLVLGFLNARDKLVKHNVFNSTALGCLEGEVERVKEKFRKSYELENTKFVNFSFSRVNGYQAANNIHPVEKYIATEQYKEFIKAIYQLKDTPGKSSTEVAAH